MGWPARRLHRAAVCNRLARYSASAQSSLNGGLYPHGEEKWGQLELTAFLTSQPVAHLGIVRPSGLVPVERLCDVGGKSANYTI